ncbi:MAG TPA: alpha/beta hydrolase-fold protein [Thermoanaerobaculia bacterium]|nr:alpha/beta hydrolase-fold protein [Thermoanaerobaculia bacterium]
MYRDYVRWWSPSLNREMEFLWFGQFGRPVILFPTSAGRFYENEDFGLSGSLADKVDRGEIQLVLVDTVNNESWYNKRVHPAVRVARHAQYDAYLRHELVPYIHNRAQRGDLVVYGASFGAYHASNFATRYPDVVSRAICFSGVYDIHSFLDGYWNDTCYFNCPTANIPNMNGEWAGRLARVEWVIATGEHDTLVQQNRDFSAMLWGKGIPNHLEIWPGVFGHDWPWWRENLRRFV